MDLCLKKGMIIKMRIRRKKWAKEELEEAKFYIDNPTEYKGKWLSMFEKKQPLQIELRMWKRKFYCKSCK